MRKVNAQDLKDLLDGLVDKGYDLSLFEVNIKHFPHDVIEFDPVWGFHVYGNMIILEM